MKMFIAAAFLISSAFAACPNSCSGHGTCNTQDQCTCFLEWAGNATEEETGSTRTAFKGESVLAEWRGADCSRRTCPRGISWSASATDDMAAQTCSHAIESECSDQGLCDRATGVCSCFPGYDGSACQRTSCPDDCSGHGTCRSNQDFAYDFAVAKTNQLLQPGGELSTERFQENYKVTYDSAWDSGMHYGCLCDAGYRGPSCALVECPSYRDPLDDKCDMESWAPADVDQTNMDVAIKDYQLQYDAAEGAAGWVAAYTTAGSIETEGGDAVQNNFYRDGKVYACFGQMSGQDCSGRGICDYSSGTCNCFHGYAGTACEGVEEMS